MALDTADPVARAGIVQAAAQRLLQASATRRPCEPVRDLLGTTDIALAYAVQQAQTDARIAAGTTIVGRKIGLTSPAVQRQIGVDRPDFGVLFDDMAVVETEQVPSERLLQPKAEAEIAFVLGTDLTDGELDVDQVRAAVVYAVAALEIVDSRVRDWDIQITDTVSDNASSGMYVLGSRQVSLGEFEPADVTMSLQLNGVHSSDGDGRACLGDPLNALSWLANTAREFGFPLCAGDVVLSGALGRMVTVQPGSTVTAELSTLGGVTVAFSK